ncbi:MAG: hypothetical protein V3576_04380 [Candidatus Cloacimonadota bacterium]
MKKSLFILTLLVIVLSLAAQEGPSYRGLARMTEKEYSFRTEFGRNDPVLETVTTGLYDDLGRLLERRISRSNLTYLGRIAYNRTFDPYTLETVHYNHMNHMTRRSVEISGDNPLESTLLEYDQRGRILSKISNRVYPETGDLWSLEYNQVGYIHRYFQTQMDSTGRVNLRIKYDYQDDPVEKHYYFYNQAGDLAEICAMASSDTLLFRRVYAYDEAGNLIAEELYDHTDTISENLSYSYDEDKRLKQKSRFAWNPRFGGRPVLIRQWEYSYSR